MLDVKTLAEKYLQGKLSDTDKERLLHLIKNDRNIDDWLRSSIEKADELLPDSVRERVITQVYDTETEPTQTMN